MTKYEVKLTSRFKKDYKRIRKQGLAIEELQKVVSVLADGKKLDNNYNDHELSGSWSGYRECHIRPDWLLIYKYYEDILVLSLTRTGSHNELFDK